MRHSHHRRCPLVHHLRLLHHCNDELRAGAERCMYVFESFTACRILLNEFASGEEKCYAAQPVRITTSPACSKYESQSHEHPLSLPPPRLTHHICTDLPTTATFYYYGEWTSHICHCLCLSDRLLQRTYISYLMPYTINSSASPYCSVPLVTPCRSAYPLVAPLRSFIFYIVLTDVT